MYLLTNNQTLYIADVLLSWSPKKECLMRIQKVGSNFERVFWGRWGSYGGLGLGPGPPNCCQNLNLVWWPMAKWDVRPGEEENIALSMWAYWTQLRARQAHLNHKTKKLRRLTSRQAQGSQELAREAGKLTMSSSTNARARLLSPLTLLLLLTSKLFFSLNKIPHLFPA